jgi:K+-transporting ATPase KdpF subunit
LRIRGFRHRGARDRSHVRREMFDLILGLAVSAGLFVYLVRALLRPDRF